VGQSAIHYLQQFPEAEIYSFEPVAATYEKLINATRPFARVHPFPCGMGREPGRTVIHVNPLDTTSSIVHQRPEDRLETIELETIDGFTEKQRVETVDFLKIDTEGFDLEVLAGATSLLRRQKIHFVQVECEPVVATKKFASFSAVAEFLEKFDYQLFGVYEQQPEWDGRNRLLYWNALFICEKLVEAGARL
jgi:FkbM family methyltransferase